MPGPPTLATDAAPLRRFALFGDLHAQVAALEMAIAFVATLGVEAMLSVGDLADGDGDLDRTVRVLQQHHVVCVRGNHDRWLVDGRLRDLPFAHRSERLRAETVDFLRGLPAVRTIATSFGVAVLCHAVGAEDMPVITPDTPARDVLAMPAFSAVCAIDGATLMLCGHTHARMVRAIGPITIVNAGTFARSHMPGFVVVDTDARTVDAFALDDALEIHAVGTSRFGSPGQDVWESSW